MRLLSFMLLAGACSKWEAEDIDGDGKTILDGDCWESNIDPTPPAGAKVYDDPVTADDIYVGAVDLPYDGIDANCDGKDDFDWDGDGYIPDEYEGIQTLGLTSTGSLPIGDCFDDPEKISGPTIDGVTISISGADIHKDAENDDPYDGIDQNCDTQPDFDADGDGYVPDRFEGIETKLTDRPPLDSGDCYDSEEHDIFIDPTGNVNPSLKLKPVDVNPASLEQYYDGADENCDGESDFDKDGDGFNIAQIECNGELEQSCDIDGNGIFEFDGGGDCNDNDSEVAPNGGAEIFYDGKDNNCDDIDGDGDKDGDGFWAINYFDILLEQGIESPDASVQPIGIIEDCWDDPDVIPEEMTPVGAANGSAQFPQLQARQVNPNAEEQFYDGVDQDCGEDDDFDLDSDGYRSIHYPNRNGLTGDDCVDRIDDPGYVYSLNLDPADINPGASETYYDGLDQDCNYGSDFDQDLDGYDSSEYGGTDCNDTDAEIYFAIFNQADPPGDGVDQNCDGFESCYLDLDFDGFGDASGATGESTTLDCSEAGFADNVNDCDDSDGTVFPSAPELCDGQVNTCGGALPVDETDGDGDGYVVCSIDSGGWDGDSEIQGGGDCDDTDSSFIPNLVWYADLDSDNFGDLNNSITSCVPPAGYVQNALDCNDQNDSVYSGAPERCDGLDNACTGVLPSNEADNDGDLFVECLIVSSGWEGDPSILDGDDCDDSDSSVYPNAPEIFNDGTDQNCDNKERCPIDDDGDGYGVSSSGGGLSFALNCIQAGFSNLDTDCDDTNARAFPGAAVNDSPTDCLVDVDFDGYGDISPNNPAISSGTDCDDLDGAISPGATEIANDGADQNCDFQELCYLDEDHDGFGDSSGGLGLSTQLSCTGQLGFSNLDTDCDDNNFAVNPNASEVCDGIDNDCDGDIDSGAGAVTYYRDQDLDGFGDPGDSIQTCTPQPDRVLNGDDCDDSDDTVYPAAPELCDGQLNDCDNSGIPSDETDDDGDDYIECDIGSNIWVGSSSIISGGDCDDFNAQAYPFAAETMGADDLNCDGLETLVLSFGSNFENCESVTVTTGATERYFLYCDHNHRWFQTRDICEAGGYYSLATIENATENTAVHNLIDNNSWFGFNDIDDEGVYTWGDNSLVTSSYLNWFGGSPPAADHSKNCFQIRSADGTWEVAPCYQSKNFVCSVILP